MKILKAIDFIATSIINSLTIMKTAVNYAKKKMKQKGKTYLWYTTLAKVNNIASYYSPGFTFIIFLPSAKVLINMFWIFGF